MYKWREGFEPNICDIDEKCRYILGKEGKNTLICIGVNPSMADKNKPDATMREILKIIEKNGYDSFIMINLYPLIKTNPNELPNEKNDKIHKENLNKIEEILNKYEKSDVLACWGDLITKRAYLLECSKDIIKLCEKYKTSFKYLSLSNKGNPTHPMRQFYNKGNYEISDFDEVAYLQKQFNK